MIQATACVYLTQEGKEWSLAFPAEPVDADAVAVYDENDEPIYDEELAISAALYVSNKMKGGE